MKIFPSSPIVPLGVKFGYKWEDIDFNGVWALGEPSLVGWTIVLRDAVGNQVDSTVTHSRKLKDRTKPKLPMLTSFFETFMNYNDCFISAMISKTFFPNSVR